MFFLGNYLQKTCRLLIPSIKTEDSMTPDFSAKKLLTLSSQSMNDPMSNYLLVQFFYYYIIFIHFETGQKKDDNFLCDDRSGKSNHQESAYRRAGL